MKNACIVSFSGWSGCEDLLSKAVGGVLQKRGQSYTPVTLLSLTNWKTKIADKTAGDNALPITFGTYERTTEDISIQTSSLGYKDKDDDPLPSMVAYVKGSAQDYDTLWNLQGSILEFTLFLKDETIWNAKKPAGANSGMKVKIALKADLPPADNGQLSFPVYFFFQSATEFKRRYLASPNFTLGDLQALVPAGMVLSATGAYAASDIDVVVKDRTSGVGYAGLTATKFEVISTNAPDVAVTAIVDNGDGNYTLTVEKDATGTPATLVSGEYAVVRATDDDATYYTYISNLETLEA